MKFRRLTSGQNICPDCIALEDVEPHTFDWWRRNKLLPREADTYCGRACKCMLVPANRRPGVIVIPEVEKTEGLKTASLKELKALDKLVLDAKELTGESVPDGLTSIRDIKKWILDNI